MLVDVNENVFVWIGAKLQGVDRYGNKNFNYDMTF